MARGRGFTLLELVLAMIVFSIIAAFITPVVVSATDSYATARRLRAQTEASAFAMERIVRVIREAPLGSTTRLDVTAASGEELVFADGSGFRLNGTDLELVVDGAASLLARGVEALEVTYVDADGVSTPGSPADAHRVHVRITVDGATLATTVFPRVNAGGGS